MPNCADFITWALHTRIRIRIHICSHTHTHTLTILRLRKIVGIIMVNFFMVFVWSICFSFFFVFFWYYTIVWVTDVAETLTDSKISITFLSYCLYVYLLILYKWDHPEAYTIAMHLIFRFSIYTHIWNVHKWQQHFKYDELFLIFFCVAMAFNWYERRKININNSRNWLMIERKNHTNNNEIFKFFIQTNN